MRYSHFLAFLMLNSIQVWAEAPPHQHVLLDNGLNVLAIEDTSSSIAAIHVGVRTGWDVPGAYPRGTTALLQQVRKQQLEMWLTEPVNSVLRDEVAGNGILSLNTEYDYLEARAQVTNACLEPALQLLGRALFDANTLSEGDLEQAKDTLRAVQHTASQRVVETTFYEFTKALYGRTSALAGPIWGDEVSLARDDITQLKDFAIERLGPNNACLTVIAPRRLEETIQCIRETFGFYEPATMKIIPKMASWEGPSKLAVTMAPDWRGASLFIGVPVPDYGSRGYLVAQLIYIMLAGSEGRIARDNTVYDLLGLNQIAGRGRAESPVSIIPPMAGPRPFLAAHVVSQPRLMEVARTLLLSHLLAFVNKPPTDDELQKAKTRLINAGALANLSRLNAAKAINMFQIYGADSKQAWHQDEVILSVTPTEIVNISRQYFSRHAVGLVLPESEGPSREAEP